MARRWRWLAGGLALTLVLAALVLWSQRAPLAQDAIDRELTRRGVPASYRVAALGFRWQRLEQVRLGDPARPDLTADWAEVRLAVGWGGVRVTDIRAGDVRLRGRLTDGRLHFGSLDRLLPPPSGKPFALPNLNLDLSDARARVDTPWGVIGARVDGRGNLAGGFQGKLAALAPRLEAAGCVGERVSAYIALSTVARSPRVVGPVRVARGACGAARLVGVNFGLDGTLGAAFDRWRGSAGVAVDALAGGSISAAGVGGRIGFSGDARATRADAALTARAAQLPAARLAALTFDGRLDTGGTLDGRATAQLMLDRAAIAALARRMQGTPIASLLAATAGQQVDLRVETRNMLRFRGRVSGALHASLSGRGLPRIDADAALAGGGMRGVARIAPYAANGARLALAPVAFAVAPTSAARLTTTAVLDGPLGDGRVEGLRAPLTVMIGSRGSIVVNPGCAPVSWRAVRISSLTLDPASLRLCPLDSGFYASRGGGGARVTAPRLAGRIGGTPVRLEAGSARFALDGELAADRVAVRLGDARHLSRLDVGRVRGRTVAGGFVGQFASASGQIGNVPLLIDSATGRWTLRGGVLDLSGNARVSDAALAPRFRPLAARGFALRVADGRVRATAALDRPGGAHVADATIEHDLRRGAGRAHVDVPGLVFGPALQPEDLTPLTVGVVALVEGRVRGAADVAWDARGVRSSGVFTTAGLDFAAAFGPVEGLATTMHFTDLLGLVSAPDQIATVRLIRAGIDVHDGRIRYRLLPDRQVGVEEGRWPFAGGTLILENTRLDFGRPAAKRLTFRVEGMDAARFVQQMEFSNIAATGTFDGVVPMVFDDHGGRIVGGHLVARAPGGTLSYVGELSDKDLGAYGKLAFDALKSLRYNRLVVDLNGALDGEFVAAIQFDGVARDASVARGPSGGGLRGIVARRALSQVARIPFKFNITARGPFRALLATARSLQDPTDLIQSTLPELLHAPVQPQESEKRP